MKFGQLIYTAAKYNIRGIEGFGVYSYTRDLQPYLNELEQLCLSSEESYMYKKLLNGDYAFIKRQQIGTDYSGRSGNYISHALVAENFNANPFVYENLFVSELTEEQKTNPDVDYLDYIQTDIQKYNVNFESDKKILSAVLNQLACSAKNCVVKCAKMQAYGVIAGLYEYLPNLAPEIEFEIGFSGKVRTRFVFDINNKIPKNQADMKYGADCLDLNAVSIPDFVTGNAEALGEVSDMSALKRFVDLACGKIDFETITCSEAVGFLQSTLKNTFVKKLFNEVDFMNTKNQEIDSILEKIDGDEKRPYVMIRAMQKICEKKELSLEEKKTLSNSRGELPSSNKYNINLKNAGKFNDMLSAEKVLYAKKIMEENIQLDNYDDAINIIDFYSGIDSGAAALYIKKMDFSGKKGLPVFKDSKELKFYEGLMEKLRNSDLKKEILLGAVSGLNEYSLKNICGLVMKFNDPELTGKYIDALIKKEIPLSENCYDEILSYVLNNNMPVKITKRCPIEKKYELKAAVIEFFRGREN